MENDLNLLLESINKAEEVFGKSFLNVQIYETNGKHEAEMERISKITPLIVKKFRQAKSDIEKSKSTNQLRLSRETIEFYQLIQALPVDKTESFLSRIIDKLKTKDLSLFTSACHELMTHKRYKANEIAIEHIEEGAGKTPDFIAKGKTEFFIECKALLSNEQLETPQIESLCKRIQKALAKKRISGVIEILISSKSVGRLTELILDELENLLLNPKPYFKVYDGFEFKFTPIKIAGRPNTEISISKMDFEIGRFEFDLQGQAILGIYGVRILPIRTQDYTSSIKNQIKKSKSQFNIKDINVLHIQFPFIKMDSLIDLIEIQTELIFNTIDGSSINALLVEFPYVIDYNEKKSEIHPSVFLPFFNPGIASLELLKENLFWLNNISIVEGKEEMTSVFLEFEVHESNKPFFYGIITNDLRYQLRFHLIKNTLLVQFQESGLIHTSRFELPNTAILVRNKMAFNVGAEKIAINGLFYKGKTTTHNTSYSK